MTVTSQGTSPLLQITSRSGARAAHDYGNKLDGPQKAYNSFEESLNRASQIRDARRAAEKQVQNEPSVKLVREEPTHTVQSRTQDKHASNVDKASQTTKAQTRNGEPHPHSERSEIGDAKLDAANGGSLEHCEHTGHMGGAETANGKEESLNALTDAELTEGAVNLMLEDAEGVTVDASSQRLINTDEIDSVKNSSVSVLVEGIEGEVTETFGNALSDTLSETLNGAEPTADMDDPLSTQTAADIVDVILARDALQPVDANASLQSHALDSSELNADGATAGGTASSSATLDSAKAPLLTLVDEAAHPGKTDPSAIHVAATNTVTTNTAATHVAAMNMTNANTNNTKTAKAGAESGAVKTAILEGSIIGKEAAESVVNGSLNATAAVVSEGESSKDGGQNALLMTAKNKQGEGAVSFKSKMDEGPVALELAKLDKPQAETASTTALKAAMKSDGLLSTTNLTAHLTAVGGRVAVPVDVRFGHSQWSGLVAERTASLVLQNVHSAQLQLDPPELGPLTVKIQVQQDQAVVNFVASNPSVKEALDSTMVKLREMLQEQGIQLADSNVSDQSQQQKESSARQGGFARGGSIGDLDIQEATPLNSLTVASGIDYFV